MPEKWLKYDTALDMKYGNLLAEVSPELKAASDIPTNNMWIFALSRSNQPDASVCHTVQRLWRSRHCITKNHRSI